VCRHVAWLGEPRSLGSVLYDAPHSLARQSRYPRHQGDGISNEDGYGAGWFPEQAGPPVRHRRAHPIHTDAAFARQAAEVASGCWLAAIRKASPGTPLTEACTAPFVDGRLLFSHNGWVDPVSVADVERPGLGDVEEAGAPVDSAVLFGLVAQHHRRGSALRDALVHVVDRFATTRGPLNLMATDGEQLVATAWGHSLFLNQESDGIAIASEPYDDHPGWHRVPDRSVVHALRGQVTVEALNPA